MRKAISCLLVLMAAIMLCTFAHAEDARTEIHWGILAGIETVDLSGTFDTGGNVPVQRYDLYMTMDSLISGLMNGRSDACYINKSIADYITNRNDGIESVAMPDQGKLRFMMGVNAEKAELYERLNAALKELIADGTVAELTETWIDNFPADREPDFKESLELDGASETLVVGVTGDMPPIDYMAADGTPSGFNVALLKKLGEKMNANIEVISLASEARIVALASGRIDIAFWINSVDAFQGNFIEGVLLTEPYASSDICMIYTSGDAGRILRAVNQVQTAEKLFAQVGVDEIYAFSHADRNAADALISLLYEAPELALNISESGSVQAWSLNLGETVLASGTTINTEETVENISTLTPGVCIRTEKKSGYGLFDRAVANAEFAPGEFSVNGQTYTSSAAIGFLFGGKAARQLVPVLSYLSANGAIQEQAAETLGILNTALSGTAYKNDAGEIYIEAEADGLRFAGTQADGTAAYTLLAARNPADLADANGLYAKISDGTADGLVLTITKSVQELTIEGVSTNYGMMHAPAVTFGVAGQLGGDAEKYTFSVMGAEITAISVMRTSGEAAAPDESETVPDNGDTGAEMTAGIKVGLEQLAQILEPIAPLTRNCIIGITE